RVSFGFEEVGEATRRLDREPAALVEQLVERLRVEHPRATGVAGAEEHVAERDVRPPAVDGAEDVHQLERAGGRACGLLLAAEPDERPRLLDRETRNGGLGQRTEERAPALE